MPDWKQPLAERLASLHLSPAREQEIVEELSQHLDDLYRERRAAGVSHEQALHGALDEIDDSDLLERGMRPLRQARRPAPLPPVGASGSHWALDAVQDVAYAARTLAHAKGWALVVVLLLALGIGANAALFTATNALLFASVPARDPDTLVRVRWAGANDAITERREYGFRRPQPQGRQIGASVSFQAYQDLVSTAAGQADLFAGAPFDPLTLSVEGRADLASGYAATGNYFAVLGVQARHGRVFTPDDDRPDAAGVAVISSRYWQAHFGGDPGVLGRIIHVNDVPLTIVGVAPPQFTGVQRTLDEAPDLWFPLSLDLRMRASSGRSGQSLLQQPTAWWLQVMGRLRPGTSPAQLQAALEGPFQHSARAGLSAYLEGLPEQQRSSARNRNRRDVPELLVDGGARGTYDVEDGARTSAAMLSAVVAVLLLIICANVANLMLSRAIARRKEMSVRLSLGATRGRLVRQLFTEALVLAAAGGALGLLVATYGIGLLPEPASSVSVLERRTLLFTCGAAILASLVFGALPALRATRIDVNTALKESGRSFTGRRSVLARTLLTVQVALSVVLIVGAGLFLQTVERLRAVDVGFDADNLLLVRIAPSASGYDARRSVELYRTLLERLAALPGVRGATLSQPALLSGSISSTDVFVHGQPAGDTSAQSADREIYYLTVAPTFFDVMGIPVLRGRGLTDADTPSSQRVAVINETAARTFFAGTDPIGKRFGSQPDRTSDVEVVGVARDARYASLREPAPPTMYVSYLQSPRAAAVFGLRTAVDPLTLAGSVREVLRQVDPNVPIADVSTQRARIEGRLEREKIFAEAYTLFGSIALLLASIGLFGLMSYSVARRTSELGIRMALGARRVQVVRMIMRESLALVAIGVVAGLSIAAASGRFVASQLFEMPAHHPPTMGIAVLVMLGVSAAAAYLPARRASRVDPVVALRQD